MIIAEHQKVIQQVTDDFYRDLKTLGNEKVPT